MFLKNFHLDKTFLKSGFWLAIEKTVLAGKGFILVYLFANLISKETYGSYQFVTSLIGMMSVLAIPGMGTAIVQAVARGQDGTFKIGAQRIFLAAMWGSLLFIFSAIYYHNKEQTEIALTLLLVSATFPIHSIASLWRYYYTGKERFDLLLKNSLIFECIALFFLLTALFIKPTVFWLILGGVVMPSFLSLLLLIKLFSQSAMLPIDQTNLIFGKKLSYAIGLATFSTFLDKLLLAYFLGFVQLAVYSVALIIPEQMKGGLVAFMVPLLPRYSQNGNRLQLRRHFLIFLFSSFALFLLMILIISIGFQFFFPQYIESRPYAYALLSILFFIPFILIETYFRSQKNERAVFASTFVSSVTGILLVCILVPIYGIWGAVAAKISGSFLQCVTLSVYFFRINR